MAQTVPPDIKPERCRHRARSRTQLALLFQLLAAAYVCYAQAPDAPTGVNATAVTRSSVQLAWTAPENPGNSSIVYFRVEYKLQADEWSNATNLTTANATPALTVTGLATAQTYSFRVSAINSDAEGNYSAEATALVAVAPGPPQNLTVTPTSKTSLSLTWLAPSDDGGYAVIDYTVYRRLGYTGAYDAGTVVAGTTLAVSPLTTGAVYDFYVVARSSVGAGAASANASAVVITFPPGTPTGLNATAASRASAQLRWNVPWSPGNFSIQYYRVSYKLQAEEWSGAASVATPDATPEFVVTGLSSAQTYSFRVSAVNPDSEGAFSAEASALVAVLPSAPRNLTITPVTKTSLSLSWLAPEDDGGYSVLDYTVYRRQGLSGPFDAGTLVVEGTTLLVGSLTTGAVYDFYVVARSSLGAGQASASANAVVVSFPPDPPTGVAVTVLTKTSARVNWVAPAYEGQSSVQYYRIYYRTDSQTWAQALSVVTLDSSTSRIVSDLSAGTTYLFRVTAVSLDGEGLPSTNATSVIAVAPSAPLSVYISGITRTSMTVSWAPPADDGGLPVTSYLVYKRQGLSGAFDAGATVSSASASYTATGLTTGLLYDFVVAAHSDAGTGALSANVSAYAVVAPSAPTSPALAMNAANTAATVTFAAPSDDGGSAITGYIVYKRTGSAPFDAGTPLSSSTFSTQFTGLDPTLQYSFKITAVNSIGEGTATADLKTTPNYAPTAVTCAQAADAILAADLTLVSATCSCPSTSLGAFSKGSRLGLGPAFEDGVVLSTGRAADAALSAASLGAGSSSGGGRSDAVETLAGATWSYDACVLDLVVTGVPEGGQLSARIAVASSELDAAALAAGSSPYSDAVAVLVNGANVATLPGGSAVTTGSLLAATADATVRLRGEWAVDPYEPALLGYAATATGFDVRATGLTGGPTAQHSVRFVVGDVRDGFLDTALFVQTGSLTAAAPTAASALTVSPALISVSAGSSTTLAASTSVSADVDRVVFTAVVPPSGEFVSASFSVAGAAQPSSACSESFGVVACAASSVAANQNVSLEVVVRVPSSAPSSTKVPVAFRASFSGVAAAITGTSTVVLSGVIDGSEPVLLPLPATVEYDVQEGYTHVASIPLRNVGGGDLSWSIAIPGEAPWLTLDPTYGTVAAGDRAFLRLRLNGAHASVARGNAYTAAVSLTTSDPGASSVAVNVTMNVKAALSFANTAVVPSTLSRVFRVNAAVTTGTETLTVANFGSSHGNPLSLRWGAANTTSWLAIAPSTATVANAVNGTATVTFNATGLSIGNYTQVVLISTNDPARPTTTLHYLLAVTDIPDAPTAVSVSRIPSKTSATLNWTAPVYTGSAPVLFYTVYYSTTSGSFSAAQSANTTDSALGWTVSGLSEGLTYYFRVTASTGVGEGAASVEASALVAVPPSPPASLLATAVMKTNLTLNWTAVSDTGGMPVTNFTVYQRQGLSGAYSAIATVSASTFSYVATGLTTGLLYDFGVAASNVVGLGAMGANVTSYAAVVPSGPLSPTLSSDATGSNVTVSWTSPADDGGRPVLGFVVYRRIGTAPYDAGTALPATQFAHWYAGLDRGVEYRFRVSAVNDMGVGELSVEVKTEPGFIATVSDCTAAAQTLVAPDVTFVSATCSCPTSSLATFSKGTYLGVGPAFEGGVILSTGRAADATLSASLLGSGSVSSGARDASVESLSGTSWSYDACYMEITVSSGSITQLSARVAFASSEFTAAAIAAGSSPHADAAAVLINDANVATVPTTSNPITVSNVLSTASTSLGSLRLRGAWAADQYETARLGYAGATTPFLVTKTGLSGGTHKIRFVVGDGRDGSLDSALFVQAKSITRLSPTVAGLTVTPSATLVAVGASVTFTGSCSAPSATAGRATMAAVVPSDAEYQSVTFSVGGVPQAASACSEQSGFVVCEADSVSSALSMAVVVKAAATATAGSKIVVPFSASFSGISSTLKSAGAALVGASGTFTEPTLMPMPSSASFDVEEGSTALGLLPIRNVGTSALSWSLAIPGDAGWLTADASSGSVAAGTTAYISLRLNGGHASVARDTTYYAPVTVNNGDAALASASVNVSMAVKPRDVFIFSSVQPSNLVRTFRLGIAPFLASESITITNNGRDSTYGLTPLSLRWGIQSLPSWLAASPITALLPSGSAVTTVTFNATSLGIGVYRQTVFVVTNDFTDLRANTSFTYTMYITDLPAAPTNATVVAVPTKTTAQLSWNAPSYVGSDPILHYNVYYRLSTQTYGAAVTVATAGPVTSLSLSGLSPGQTYFFRVTAVTAVGEGASSNETSRLIATVPSAPLSFAIGSVTESSIDLSWTAPLDDGGLALANYTLYRRSNLAGAYTALASLLPGTTSYSDTGLTAGQLYDYYIAARNSLGLGAASTNVTATAATVPFAPYNLQVVSVGLTSISISWTAPNGTGGLPILEYVVFTRQDFNPWSAGSGTGSTITSATFTGLATGSTYSYAIAARTSLGLGPQSSIVSAVPSSPPSQPLNLTAADVATTSLTLSWAGPSSLGGLPIRYYDVRVTRIATGNVTILPTSGNVRMLAIMGLVPAANYNFEVRAVTAAGNGTFSSALLVRMFGVPSAPLSPLATVAGETSVTLAWSAPVDSGDGTASGVEIAYHSVQAASNSAFTTVVASATADGTARNYTFANSVRGVSLYLRVAACNLYGCGPYAAAGSAVTPFGVPSVPKTATLVWNIAKTLVTISWTAPADVGNGASSGITITGYSVQVASSASNFTTWSSVYSGTVLTTTYAISSDTTKYAFRITASNAAGTSDAVIVFAVAITDKPATIVFTPNNGVSTSTGTGVLSWTAPLDSGDGTAAGVPIDTYIASYSTAANFATVTTLGNFNASVLSASVSGLTFGTTYYFRVQATTYRGSGAYATTSGAVYGIPDAPTSLASSGFNLTSIGLTWAAPITLRGLPVSRYSIAFAPSGSSSFSAPSYTNGTSIAVEGLVTGRAYSFRVCAENAVGVGACANSSDIPSLSPSAPLSLSISGYSKTANTGAAGSLTLSWLAPPSTGGSPITAYSITTVVNGVVSSKVNVSASTLSSVRSGLMVNTNYTFLLTAWNARGESSPISAATFTAVDPQAPTNFRVTAYTRDSMSLTWTPPADTGGAPVWSYEVQYRLGTTGTASTFLTRSTANSTVLFPITSGYYTKLAVRAINTASFASAYSSPELTQYVAGAPSAPRSLAFLNVLATSATLTWLPPADNGGSGIMNYHVFLANVTTSTDAFGNVTTVVLTTPVATVGNVTTYALTSLPSGTTQTYAVMAFNGAYNGSLSVPASVFVATLPGAPTGVSASSPTGSKITVSWTAPASDGGVPIQYYTIAANNGMRFVVNATEGQTSYTANFPGLSARTAYTFNVSATNQMGTGPFSSTTSTVTTTDSTAPTAPTGLGVEWVTARRANLTWVAPSDLGGASILYYTVKIPGTVYSSGVYTGGSATWFVVDQLDPATAYSFTVSASSIAVAATFPVAAPVLTSPESSSFAFTTGSADLPGVPGPVSLVSVARNSASVRWMATSDLNASPATSYVLNWRSENNAVNVSVVVSSSTFAYTIPSLNASTTYLVSVAAENSVGCSNFTGTLSVTTLAPAGPSAPTRVAVTGRTTSSIAISWTAPADAGGQAIVQYNATACSSVSCTSVVVAADGSLATTFTGLAPSTGYTITVFAQTASFNGPSSTPLVTRTAADAALYAIGSNSGVACVHEISGGSVTACVVNLAFADASKLSSAITSFDHQRRIIYGVFRDTSDGQVLAAIDLGAGKTVLSSASLAGLDAVQLKVMALEYDTAEGTLYAVVGANTSTAATLQSLNPTTGAATLLATYASMPSSASASSFDGLGRILYVAIDIGTNVYKALAINVDTKALKFGPTDLPAYTRALEWNGLTSTLTVISFDGTNNIAEAPNLRTVSTSDGTLGTPTPLSGYTTVSAVHRSSYNPFDATGSTSKLAMAAVSTSTGRVVVMNGDGSSPSWATTHTNPIYTVEYALGDPCRAEITANACFGAQGGKCGWCASRGTCALGTVAGPILEDACGTWNFPVSEQPTTSCSIITLSTPGDCSFFVRRNQPLTVSATVKAPASAAATQLDVLFVQDVADYSVCYPYNNGVTDTTTCGGALYLVQNAASTIETNINSAYGATTTVFGAASFVDAPYSTFGPLVGAGGFDFKLDNALNSTTLSAALGAMSVVAGGDNDNGQLVALLKIATEAYSNIGWRSASRRVAVMITGSGFHDSADGGSDLTAPANLATGATTYGSGGTNFPSLANIRTVLAKANIVPIFIVPNDATVGPQYDALVSALGFGMVKKISDWDGSQPAGQASPFLNSVVSAVTTALSDIAGSTSLVTTVDDDGLASSVVPAGAAISTVAGAARPASAASAITAGGSVVFNVTIDLASLPLTTNPRVLTFQSPGFGSLYLRISTTLSCLPEPTCANGGVPAGCDGTCVCASGWSGGTCTECAWSSVAGSASWLEVLPADPTAAGPLGRTHAVSVWYKGGMYVYGGDTGIEVPIMDSRLWRFDPVASAWSIVEPGNYVMPPGRFGALGVLYGNRFVVFGGYASVAMDSRFGMYTSNEVWSLNLDTRIWKDHTYQCGTRLGSGKACDIRAMDIVIVLDSSSTVAALPTGRRQLATFASNLLVNLAVTDRGVRAAIVVMGRLAPAPIVIANMTGDPKVLSAALAATYNSPGTLLPTGRANYFEALDTAAAIFAEQGRQGVPYAVVLVAASPASSGLPPSAAASRLMAAPFNAKLVGVSVSLVGSSSHQASYVLTSLGMTKYTDYDELSLSGAGSLALARGFASNYLCLRVGSVPPVTCPPSSPAKTVPGIPEPRRHPAGGIVHGRYLVVHGGVSDDRGKNFPPQVFSNTWRLDLQSVVNGGTDDAAGWVLVPAVGNAGLAPSQRYHHGAAVVDNALYIYGGIGPARRSDDREIILTIGQTMNDLWKGVFAVGDATEVTWTELTSASNWRPYGASGFGYALFQSRYMLVFGGFSDRFRGALVNDFWQYDTTTNAWTELQTYLVNGTSPVVTPTMIREGPSLVVPDSATFCDAKVALLFGGLLAPSHTERIAELRQWTFAS